MKKRARNGGTWTEAKYWGSVRACLRNKFRWYSWKPAKDAVERHTRTGRVWNATTGRWNQTKEFQCQICKKWFFRAPTSSVTEKMHVDHIEECGSLNNATDLAMWLERLTCEDTYKFQPLCAPCHKGKTGRNNKR